ncbi:MAG: IS1 family transposase [Methylococcales bacterium]|nr:IS1 family transposase [Methylococcales bacterium]
MSLADAKMTYSSNCNRYDNPLISRDIIPITGGTYARHLPADQHELGKKNTQKIEPKNLNLRTWVKRLTRKTICFSKATIMHIKPLWH